MVQEEIRKGPWTEQEDLQLDCFVGLFGDRRWDFIAKVSGLKRTGKSCRLRWVNYLHPGLKRGKMTPHEEQLVLELHAKWGNRWSRIAKKLPGRTDNEIKNYWRTHTRKKAQKRKRAMSPSSLSSHCCSLSPHDPITDSLPFEEAGEVNLYDTGGQDTMSSKGNNDEHDQEDGEREPSMDEIWNDIALLGDGLTIPAYYDACMEEEFNFSCPPMAPPIWDFCPDSLLRADEESEMLLPIGDHQFASFCENEEASLIG